MVEQKQIVDSTKSGKYCGEGADIVARITSWQLLQKERRGGRKKKNMRLVCRQWFELM